MRCPENILTPIECLTHVIGIDERKNVDDVSAACVALVRDTCTSVPERDGREGYLLIEERLHLFWSKLRRDFNRRHRSSIV